MGREDPYDVLVIGSGMGGMTTATALSRVGHRVLLLEQGQVIGGLTHTFSREGFTWDVGLHYCGTFRRDQPGGKMLDWLSGGTVEFRSVGTVYDTLHFPDDFQLAVGRPVEAFQMERKDRFPDHAAEVDAYFEALHSGEAALRLATVERALPEPLRSAHRWWNEKKIRRWCGRTTGEVLDETVSDPQLAAVLAAQWGTFGGAPQQASFGIHATILGHYLDGAGYPVGGASAIARGLVPVIEAAGGSTRTDTFVRAILIEDGRAVGVRTGSGEELRAPVVVSAIGAAETVERLLPEEVRQQEWAVEIAELRPSVCHFEIYLGFRGDIARYGATRSNHWFYETWDTDEGIWSDLDGPGAGSAHRLPRARDPARRREVHRARARRLLRARDDAAPHADGGAHPAHTCSGALPVGSGHGDSRQRRSALGWDAQRGRRRSARVPEAEVTEPTRRCAGASHGAHDGG